MFFNQTIISRGVFVLAKSVGSLWKQEAAIHSVPSIIQALAWFMWSLGIRLRHSKSESLFSFLSSLFLFCPFLLMEDDSGPGAAQAKKKRSMSSKKKHKVDKEGEGEGDSKRKEKDGSVLSPPRSPRSLGRRVMNFLSVSTNSDDRSGRRSPHPHSSPSSSSSSQSSSSSSSNRVASERNLPRPLLSPGMHLSTSWIHCSLFLSLLVSIFLFLSPSPEILPPFILVDVTNIAQSLSLSAFPLGRQSQQVWERMKGEKESGIRKWKGLRERVRKRYFLLTSLPRDPLRHPWGEKSNIRDPPHPCCPTERSTGSHPPAHSLGLWLHWSYR